MKALNGICFGFIVNENKTEVSLEGRNGLERNGMLTLHFYTYLNYMKKFFNLYI